MKKGYAYLVAVNGVVLTDSLASSCTLRLPTRKRRAVHSKQLVGTKGLAPLSGGNDYGGPMVLRDAAPLLPFLDRRAVLVDVNSHGGQRFPSFKQLSEGPHDAECASDGLSGQAPPMIPMTLPGSTGTISPMGRATTPARFRAEMAKRLISARVMARYETKRQAAEALGITLDRYEKWESGRTPVPAQYVNPVCQLFNIDANYLFGLDSAAASSSRKTA